MENRLDELWAQLRHLKTIEIAGIQTPIELLICGDYKFLCAFYGHQGAASKKPCLLCLAQRPLPKDAAELRTLETIVVGQDNFTKLPIFPIPMSAIIPPSFHILHGVAQNVLDLVEQKAIEAGNAEEYGLWLQEVHCRRRKRGQNFTGSQNLMSKVIPGFRYGSPKAIDTPQSGQTMPIF